MVALPPSELGSAVGVALGVCARLGTRRHAGRNRLGWAMRSGSERPS